jgi:hypothetical protein
MIHTTRAERMVRSAKMRMEVTGVILNEKSSKGLTRMTRKSEFCELHLSLK